MISDSDTVDLSSSFRTHYRPAEGNSNKRSERLKTKLDRRQTFRLGLKTADCAFNCIRMCRANEQQSSSSEIFARPSLRQQRTIDETRKASRDAGFFAQFRNFADCVFVLIRLSR